MGYRFVSKAGPMKAITAAGHVHPKVEGVGQFRVKGTMPHKDPLHRVGDKGVGNVFAPGESGYHGPRAYKDAQSNEHRWGRAAEEADRNNRAPHPGFNSEFTRHEQNVSYAQQRAREANHVIEDNAYRKASHERAQGWQNEYEARDHKWMHEDRKHGKRNLAIGGVAAAVPLSMIPVTLAGQHARVKTLQGGRKKGVAKARVFDPRNVFRATDPGIRQARHSHFTSSGAPIHNITSMKDPPIRRPMPHIPDTPDRYQAPPIKKTPLDHGNRWQKAMEFNGQGSQFDAVSANVMGGGLLGLAGLAAAVQPGKKKIRELRRKKKAARVGKAFDASYLKSIKGLRRLGHDYPDELRRGWFAGITGASAAAGIGAIRHRKSGSRQSIAAGAGGAVAGQVGYQAVGFGALAAGRKAQLKGQTRAGHNGLTPRDQSKIFRRHKAAYGVLPGQNLADLKVKHREKIMRNYPMELPGAGWKRLAAHTGVGNPKGIALSALMTGGGALGATKAARELQDYNYRRKRKKAMLTKRDNTASVASAASGLVAGGSYINYLRHLKKEDTKALMMTGRHGLVGIALTAAGAGIGFGSVHGTQRALDMYDRGRRSQMTGSSVSKGVRQSTEQIDSFLTQSWMRPNITGRAGTLLLGDAYSAGGY